MLISQRTKTDRLDDQLRAAEAATEHLFQRVMDDAGERLSTIRRMGKTEQIDRLLGAGAYADAAFALLNIELPNWKVRRLVLENGEWLCSLSCRAYLPIELDDTAEARHAVLSLALLMALLEARRRNGTELISVSAEAALGPPVHLCCDNFGR